MSNRRYHDDGRKRHDHPWQDGRVEFEDGLIEKSRPAPKEIDFQATTKPSRNSEHAHRSHRRETNRSSVPRQEINVAKLPKKIISDCQCSYCREAQQLLASTIMAAKRDGGSDYPDDMEEISKSSNNDSRPKQRWVSRENEFQETREASKNQINCYERIIATLLKALIKKCEVEKTVDHNLNPQKMRSRSSSRPVASPCIADKMPSDHQPQSFCYRSQLSEQRWAEQPLHRAEPTCEYCNHFSSRPTSAPTPARNNRIVILPSFNSKNTNQCPYYSRFGKYDDDNGTDKKINEKIEDVLPVLLQLIATKKCHFDKIKSDDNNKKVKKKKNKVCFTDCDENPKCIERKGKVKQTKTNVADTNFSLVNDEEH